MQSLQVSSLLTHNAIFFIQTFSRANYLLKFQKQTEPVIRPYFPLTAQLLNCLFSLLHSCQWMFILFLLTDNRCIHFPSSSFCGTLQDLTKYSHSSFVKCLSKHSILHSYKKLSQIDIDDSILTAQVCSKWKENYSQRRFCHLIFYTLWVNIMSFLPSPLPLKWQMNQITKLWSISIQPHLTQADYNFWDQFENNNRDLPSFLRSQLGAVLMHKWVQVTKLYVSFTKTILKRSMRITSLCGPC